MSCSNSHGISIGSIGQGAGDSVTHVLVTNCKFFGGQAAARIKTVPGGGSNGVVSDVIYQDIQVTGVKNAIEVNQCYQDTDSCTSKPSGVKITGVTFRRFSGSAEANLHGATSSLASLSSTKKPSSLIGLVSCGSAESCKGISMSEINVKSQNGASGKLACTNSPAISACSGPQRMA